MAVPRGETLDFLFARERKRKERLLEEWLDSQGSNAADVISRGLPNLKRGAAPFPRSVGECGELPVHGATVELGLGDAVRLRCLLDGGAG